MTLGARLRKEVRFTPEQCDRFEKALRFCGLNAQNGLLQAAIRWTEEKEAEREGRAQRKRERGERAAQASGQGLFRNQPIESAPVETPAPAPVVVNVGMDRSADDLIERLAKHILEARDYERETKRREALSAIKIFAKDDGDRQAMIEKLNAALERAEKKPDSVFDKLTGGAFSGWTKGILGS